MDEVAFVLVIAGLIGCFLPVLPGIPLVYAGILVQHFTDPDVHYPFILLIFLGLATAIIAFAQYVLPIWSTKQFGASKEATYGAIVGLIFGIFTSFLGPFGIILGPFIGALLVELFISKKPIEQALKSGSGAVLGILASTVIEFLGSLVLAGIFVWNYFQ